jgi:hypothetical protein
MNNYFVSMADETADISSHEQLSIIVRFINEKGEIDSFWVLV